MSNQESVNVKFSYVHSEIELCYV